MGIARHPATPGDPKRRDFCFWLYPHHHPQLLGELRRMIQMQWVPQATCCGSLVVKDTWGMSNKMGNEKPIF